MSKNSNKIVVRRLNQEGLKKIAEYCNNNYVSLDKRKTISKTDQSKYYVNKLQSIPFDLGDKRYTKETINKMTIDQIDFSKIKNRYDLGKYLHGRLNNNISEDELNGQGLWTWLTLFYWSYVIRQDSWMPRMEAIVPLYTSKSSNNEIGAPFEVNQSLEYRHSVRGFYLFYDLWGDKCSVLASKKLNATGDGVETWGSRLFLRRHPVIMGALYKIYADKDGLAKPGTFNKGFGSARRSVDSINGMLVTHNFSKMKKAAILKNEMGPEYP